MEKPKYKYCEKVKLELIKVKLHDTEKELVERIRFVTNIGDITHKPRKVIKTETNKNGLVLVNETTERYSIDELRKEFPFFNAMIENLREGKQELTLSFCEFTSYNEKDDEEIFYKFMRKGQWNNIYYPAFDKNDDKLKEQETWRLKYQEMPM